MREQSCDDGEDAQRAHEAQGQVAPVPCFRPVSPCYFRQATPPRPAPGCARFLFSSWSLRRNHRRQVVPGVSCFSAVIYRNRRLGLTLWLRHEARKWLTRMPGRSAFTRVFDALCAGMSGKKNSPGRGDYFFFFFPARRFFGGGLYTVASISRANRAARAPRLSSINHYITNSLNTILNTIRKRLNGDRSNCVFGFVWRKMP